MSYHNTMMNDIGDKFKKPTPKFRLETQDEDFIYKPDSRQFTFYQICRFPVDKKHKVRKITFNELGETLKSTESDISSRTLNRFLKGCPTYKYSLYGAYNLENIGYPDVGEILVAQSQILNEY